MSSQKIIIFGTGGKLRFERKVRAGLFEQFHIIAYLDNNDARWGKEIDGVPIVSPARVHEFSYDKIVLMADYVKDMWKQLASLGVPPDRILVWDQFFCMDRHGIFIEHGSQVPAGHPLKKVLMISADLNYSGGAIAIWNAAKALSPKRYDVTVAAPEADVRLLREMTGRNIRVVIAPGIAYPQQEELDWIEQFDVVLVNVFPMIRCACVVSHYKPTVWWIHESSVKYSRIYSLVRDNQWEFDDPGAMERLNIQAVSRKAQENFNFYYASRISEILPYGIPDTFSGNKGKAAQTCVFAVIGTVYPLKAQMLFLDAAGMLSKDGKKQAEFWIIGACGKNAYAQAVCEKAAAMPGVRILGELTQEQMAEAYQEIDVVVCPSLEETMSLTVTEGLMMGKVCIATEETGIADYLTDGTDGLICRAGSVQSLYEKMRWVLENPDACRDIRADARKTYEKYFTMEAFGKRLEKVIEDTERADQARREKREES